MKDARKLVVALLVLVAVGALAACGGSDGDTTETSITTETSSKESAPVTGSGIPTIEVRDGEPVGGVQTLEYSAGDEVRFRVSSDAAEEVHVHGYDVAKEVPAGGTIEFDFPADLEGIYEVELEELAVQIAELRVNP